jgi:DNA processing protein
MSDPAPPTDAPRPDDERTGLWIAFNRVGGIGPARLATLLDLCGGRIEAAWRAPVHTLRDAHIDRSAIEKMLDLRRTLDPAREVERLRRAGVRACTWDDADYPAALRTIDRPPYVLFVRGELRPTDEVAVAVVGTRHASTYGREVAHTLATALAQSGVTVVSGLALGVDTVAHRAALDAGGRTLAVLGSGVDQIYPAQNRALGEQVIGQGALISDYPLGTRPEARNFPPRNRLISGLSKAVVIVEAGERSGALITAEFAAEQGREVFAVPGSILNAGSAGCNRLIREGATPLLAVDDLLAYLDLERTGAQRAARAAIPAEPQEAALLAHLGLEPRHMDEIVRAAGMPPAAVGSLLAILEIKGLVRQPTPLYYVRA